MVVDSGSTSTGWWRKWSDGWIEQGGRFTANELTEKISLVKPFANTDYCLLVNGNIVGNANGNWGYSEKTKTTFSILNAYNAKGFDWFACGNS